MVLFKDGFRSFFPLAAFGAIWAVLGFPLSSYIGVTPFGHLDPVKWHQHELLFGYAPAALAGFLLTAIPNWTGRPTVAAPILGGLLSLWIIGRICMALSGQIDSLVAAALDCGFLLALALVVLRELLLSGNRRNLVVALAVFLLASANITFHAGYLSGSFDPGYGSRAGLSLFILLIALVGGRIVPNFTRNWLQSKKIKNLPATFGLLDKVALAALIIGMALWVVLPEAWFSALGLVLCGVLHLMRLARWKGGLVLSEPLLAVLHLGYLWLALGLILLGATGLAPGMTIAAHHAIAVGAIGTMTLGVMSRAILGHSGHPLVSNLVTNTVFLFITLAAVLRVLAPQIPTHYQTLIVAAGLFWCGAFSLFLVRFLPLCSSHKS